MGVILFSYARLMRVRNEICHTSVDTFGRPAIIKQLITQVELEVREE